MSVAVASLPNVASLKPVLNFHEAAVDKLLGDYAAAHGYRILLKPRLRDIIDTDDQDLTRRERNFLFTAHLDFVAADVETKLPVLAVEYDGPQHARAEQVERDSIKDRLLELAHLPLVRIDNLFTRKEGRWRVLTYILAMHEAGKAFYDAQDAGLIPEDEPFIHTSIIDTSDPARARFTGLDIDALAALNARLFAKRSVWHGQWWRAADGAVEARCVLALPSGQYLSSVCRMRQFAVEGIAALQVAEELATVELAWLAERYDAGEAVALSPGQGAALLSDLTNHGRLKSDAGWSLHWSAGMPDS